MKISIREEDDVKIVYLEGEMDTNTSPEVMEELDKLRNNGVKKILLNLENLDFVSSAGLRVFLATAQQLQASGGVFRVCMLNQEIKEVFDISGFSTLLLVFDNEAKGLAGL
jgi:anti-sigma B factor antagonist